MSEGGSGFPPTRWSAVLGLGSDDHALRTRSFDALVEAYWKPVYKYVRLRWRRPVEEAQDSTQSFFLAAFEREFLADYDPSRARFRTFLRVCLDGHLANEAKAEGRKKRGGDFAIVSLEFDVAERELVARAVDGADAIERAFDREWARSLLELAVSALREECTAAGRTDHFQLFARYDLADPPESRPTYDDLAREFAIPVTTVTNRLAGARRALRRLVLEKLHAITSSEEEFRDEARFLLGHDPESGA